MLDGYTEQQKESFRSRLYIDPRDYTIEETIYMLGHNAQIRESEQSSETIRKLLIELMELRQFAEATTAARRFLPPQSESVQKEARRYRPYPCRPMIPDSNGEYVKIEKKPVRRSRSKPKKGKTK